MTTPLHIAVGIIKDADGKILISKRLDGKHLAGFWEFPGGKVEAGESVFEALCRELQEELAINVHTAQSFIALEHQYPEKNVLLDTWLISDYSGQAQGSEGQEIRWVNRDELADFSFPEANLGIIELL